jgi:copper ion binding protein
MKERFFSLLALFVVTLAANAAIDTLSVRINGMKCEECGHKVLTVLRKVDGVGGIQFNYERRTAVIAYDNAKTCTDTIYARLAATNRYKATTYDPSAVLRRGMGVRIDDMHCQKCVDRIMTCLEKIAGIDSLSPHLDKHYVFVRYDANRTSKDIIRTSLIEIGYTPVNYYSDPKVCYAYYMLPEGAATQDAVEAVIALDGVEDVNVNPRRNSMAVTFFKDETTAEKLFQEIHEAGVEASLPPDHECQEEEK